MIVGGGFKGRLFIKREGGGGSPLGGGGNPCIIGGGINPPIIGGGSGGFIFPLASSYYPKKSCVEATLSFIKIELL